MKTQKPLFPFYLSFLKLAFPVLIIAGLSGCAVYPEPSYDTYYGSPVVGSPYVVEQQPVYIDGGNGGFVNPGYGYDYGYGYARPRPYYPYPPQVYGNPRDYDGRPAGPPPGLRPGPPPNAPNGWPGSGPNAGPGARPPPPPPPNVQQGPRPGPRPGPPGQGPAQGPRPNHAPDQNGDGIPDQPARGDNGGSQFLYPNGTKPGHH